MFLAVRAETSSPSSVSRPLEKKNLSSNTPRGVCTYLPLHTRLTVDSCMSICRATCCNVSGRRKAMPLSKNSRCSRMMQFIDLDHRAPALLDGLDQPARRVELALNVLAGLVRAFLAVGLLLLAEHALVGGRDAQPRQVPVVEQHDVVLVDALDQQVGRHVLGILSRDLEARTRVERGDDVGRRLHVLHRALELAADLREAPVHQVVELAVDEAPGQACPSRRAPRAG